MKLIEIKKITGKIRVQTGLHIGGGDTGMEIGGMDNPIIRNKVTNEPYIPGSSLKGKMRSLMEWDREKLSATGDVHTCQTHEEAKDCPICRIFGISASSAGKKEENKIKLGPTRLVVRDAHLSKEYSEKFRKGEILVEEKAENSINRITAVANPRPIERVVPGTEFDLEITYKIFDIEDDDDKKGSKDRKNFETLLPRALKLLQDDFLGGGGSRGSGKIEFVELKDEQGNVIDISKVKIGSV